MTFEPKTTASGGASPRHRRAAPWRVSAAALACTLLSAGAVAETVTAIPTGPAPAPARPAKESANPKRSAASKAASAKAPPWADEQKPTLAATVGPTLPGRPTPLRPGALTGTGGTTGGKDKDGKTIKTPMTSFERRGGKASSSTTTPGSTVTDPAGSTAPGGTKPSGASGTGATTGIADSQAEREFNSCHKFPGNRRIVKLNMKPDTELGDLISWISSITCKQFLLPGTIPSNSKKVTVVAPQLITPEEAYQLFLAALDSVGLTVQESGKFYRIIETGRAKMGAPLPGEDGETPPGDRYITRLVRVEHADANELSQVLLRLKTEQGDIIVYPPQGALIVTDLESSIVRMLKIVDELDQPTLGEKVWMVRMKNTAATEMAQKLAEIFKVDVLGGKARGGAAPPPGQPGAKGGRGVADLAAEMTISKMIPDERSNQLIVIATERAYARLLTLIHKLDVPIEGGDGRIHVYYCENANCDELGQTLTAITGVAVSGGGSTRARRGAAPAAAPAAPAAGGQLPLLFEGEMRVSFDRPTNALIILSSLKDYQSLRRVIEKLDSPRKQVFVEALVMEVSLDKSRTLGASFHGGVPNVPIFGKQSLVLGGLDITKTLNPGGLLTGSGDSLLGLAAGVIGPPIPNAGSTLNLPSSVSANIPAFGLLVSALQQNNDVNVLSTPHLLIMNNEDGEISVGQNLPFQGASFGGAGASAFGGIPLATPVQRTDVALKMKLTPHVNEHDMIRLEVDQEIQDILSPNFNGLGPATSKRSAKTTVVARDQQTIVIGGLTQDREVEKIVKIPFLGDIPILGFFFRNTTKSTQKTNIVIALTPYVITDQADLRRVLEKKLKERREFVERFGKQDVVNPEATIDYRRKRGMLEEINRGVKEIEEEEDALQRNREKDSQEEAGSLDIPMPSSRPLSSVPPAPTPSVPGATATGAAAGAPAATPGAAAAVPPRSAGDASTAGPAPVILPVPVPNTGSTAPGAFTAPGSTTGPTGTPGATSPPTPGTPPSTVPGPAPAAPPTPAEPPSVRSAPSSSSSLQPPAQQPAPSP